jgi:arylsulfatase B
MRRGAREAGERSKFANNVFSSFGFFFFYSARFPITKNCNFHNPLPTARAATATHPTTPQQQRADSAHAPAKMARRLAAAAAAAIAALSSSSSSSSAAAAALSSSSSSSSSAAAASAASLGSSAPTPPKVLLTVIVDDLGWANVGWHAPTLSDPSAAPLALRINPDGSRSADLTPHLSGLAAEGRKLDRFLVHFTCTPSRSSFLTGRLPVHVQTTLANPDVQTSGIPRNMTALPLRLQEAGVTSHSAGKWDMGFSTFDHTPEGRGFNTSLVYAEHMNMYFSQQICPTGTSCPMATDSWLVDLWSDGAGAAGLNGTAYIEYLFRDRLMETVNKYNPDTDGPIWIHYTPHVAHWPLQVPEEWYNRYETTDDEPGCGSKIPYVWPGANNSVLACRRQYIAMLGLVDEIVGNLTDALKAKGVWDQTLMFFSGDNGGSMGTDENAANNYPLRGGKYYPMEGGIRSPAFVSGGYLPASVRGTTLEAPVHIADYYGSILGLYGLDPFDKKAAAAGLPPVDSLDVWPVISGANSSSPRTEVPVREDVLLQFAADGSEAWKLINGNVAGGAGWMSPLYPNSTSPKNDPFSQGLDCSKKACLFEVVSDPGEHNDVADENPDIVSSMAARIAQLAKGFFSNSDKGTAACPKNVTGDCMCWMAINKYGGYLGPWQI